MNIAVILAGGIGSRVGANIPKQFIEVEGKPILAYTIEVFQNHPMIDAIEVVCVKSYLSYMKDFKVEYGFNKLKWVVEGGDDFQKSVLNGIINLEGKISSNDNVIIHFGASPFITDDIITDAINVCSIKGNAISTIDYFLLSGVKKKETSVTDPDNYTDEYINRDTIACMGSPHAFKYGFVLDMYTEALKSGVINTVEPHTTTLMFKMGKPIYFSKGSQLNIKITKAEDVELFEGYVLMKQRKNALK